MNKIEKNGLITLSKLYRPPIPLDFVFRKEVLTSLSQHPEKPLLLVSAPAGYGKSMLVNCWLESGDVSSTWVSLDKNDNDLRLFLAYFISALRVISPVTCGEILQILKVSHLPPVSYLARKMINELDQIGKSFIIVLDDYHFIHNKEIHEFIAELLKYPSRFMQIVLISRRDPPLPLASLRAKAQLHEVRTQDLCFSVEDTHEFMQKVLGKPIDRTVCVPLAKKTEGWVTGLRLATLSLQNSGNQEADFTDLLDDNHYIMDYVHTLVSRQSPAVQDYLLKTSILSRFCASLCDAVCYADPGLAGGGYSLYRGEEFLRVMNDTNLFLVPLDNKQEWYRYHHLLRGVLRRMLVRRFQPHEIKNIHRLASDWYAATNCVEEALAHAHKSGATAAALRIVKLHRHKVMNLGQWYRLNKWLSEFSFDTIKESPDLLLTKAWIYQREASYSQLFDTLDRLGRVNISLKENHSPPSQMILLEVEVLKSFQYFLNAQVELAEASARYALANLSADYYSLRGFCIIVLSCTLQILGNQVQARELVYEALQSEAGSVSSFKSMLLAALCFSSWIAADLNRLHKIASQMLSYSHEHGLAETAANACYFSGVSCYKQNKLELAEQFLTQVVHEQAIPSIVNYCHSSFALALTYQAMGREEEACATLDAVTHLMLETNNPEMFALCEMFRVELAVYQGNFSEAEQGLQNCNASAGISLTFRFYNPYLTFARLLVAKKTIESLREADTILAGLYEFYILFHASCDLIGIVILQAMTHAARGCMPEALSKLERALALGEPGGFIRPFLDQGLEMANLLACLLEQKPHLRYARQICKAFDVNKNLFRRHSDPDNTHSLPRSETFPASPLSNREIEVLRMLSRGVSNNEIAKTMFISPETVKRHLSTIYRKLKTRNRHQAVLAGKSIGVL